MKIAEQVPKLYIWTNQMLFLSVFPRPYKEHSVVSDKLLVCMHGELKIKTEKGQWQTTKSCLIKAGITFDDDTIDATKAVGAIYFLAPLTQDYAALESIMPKARDGVNYGHPLECELIETLKWIQEDCLPPEKTYALLRDFIVLPELRNVCFKAFDSRVIETVYRIRRSVNINHTVEEYASHVHLSASRLEKLFKEEIGVPITKYRMRYRVFVSIIHLTLGSSLTDAALAAGFASMAHFSKCYSAINGIPPSSTFLKPPFLEVILASEVYKELVPVINSQQHSIYQASNPEFNVSEKTNAIL